MVLSFAQGERERLNREAMETVTAYPRVIDLIARGARRNPDGKALVYLRTATGENPAKLTYDELMGLFEAATDWFRTSGITTTDAIAILVQAAAHCNRDRWKARICMTSATTNNEAP